MGFENDLYVDEFEGIVADYRGAFKWQGSFLYYRYAKDGEFGVARVNTSGTTASRFSETVIGQNHLNFAFDVTSAGIVYFVYSETYDGLVYDGGYTSTINFNNELSDISVPVALRVVITRVTVTSSDTLTLTGTDVSGATITENFDLSSYVGSGNITIDLTTTQSFVTITELQGTGLAFFTTGTFSTIKISPVAGSVLRIKRRTNSGSETTILTDTQDLNALTALDDAGGAYLGAHECLYHNSQLYFLAPIQRVNEDSGTYTRSREKAAGMVLFSCDVTAATPTLTVVEKWDFVSHSACNLTVHANSIHYTEQPIAASKFKPINPDL